jgi:hypothetical protein
METIEFIIDGEHFTAEESEGKYSIVKGATFIGQMYKESKGWSWEEPTREDHHYPWTEISEKIDRHLANVEQAS